MKSLSSIFHTPIRNIKLCFRWSLNGTNMAKPYTFMNFSRILLLLFTLIAQIGYAQLPSDLSKVKASQITDAQLQDFIARANASGLTEAQMEEEFTKRLMPAAEIAILKSRIKMLQPAQVSNSGEVPITNKPREISTEAQTGGPAPITLDANSIFGAELFTNTNLTFAPNLRIPTPKNYIIGPDDELQLDISGVNISQQNLLVSPEGKVSIKYAGPLQISGLSIEEAKSRITNILRKYYPAINSGGTKVQLTLGNIRTNTITIIGAVKKPGTYQISSLATLFNALYVSGGPTDNGSFRNIQLYRNNKLFITADLYDFLVKTDRKSDVRLEDNDIIKIPFAEIKVQLMGQVNRPCIFEIKKNETLNNLIDYSGGFLSNAYKARITGERNTDFEKRVLDIEKNNFANFILQSGDVFTVGTILNRFENRIVINGAVFKPGVYSFKDGLTLPQLIAKAEGLKEDAYTKRVIINRKRDDLTVEIISTEISTTTQNFLLKKDDEINISSIFDIKEKFTVTITGAVRSPNTVAFEDSLSLKSLILQAGGFADNATGKGITIARRKRNIQTNTPGSSIVDIITIDDEKDLSKKSADILLQPFDIVSVKVDPYYKSQISVSINGEVLVPGNYTLQSREERLSSLVQRAGGVLYTANLDGARLKRKNSNNQEDIETAQKVALAASKDSSGIVIANETKPFTEVAIDLKKIIANPNSSEDILLLDGDELIIPIITNTISISGEVYKPLDVQFELDKTFKEYLSDAGGITPAGSKKRAYVVYANGKAQKVKRFFFFRTYPTIEPDTKIYIPKIPERKGANVAIVGIIVSGIASLITALAIFSR